MAAENLIDACKLDVLHIRHSTYYQGSDHGLSCMVFNTLFHAHLAEYLPMLIL